MGKITSRDIVDNALEMGDKYIHGAIISLMFTTGLHTKIVRDITIKNLVQAADMSFEENEPHTIDVLLDKDGNDMFLCWSFERDSKHQVIFSSPNTSKYIIKYLNYNERFYDFDVFDEVFRTEDKDTKKFDRIKDNFIHAMFYNKKKALKKYKYIPPGIAFTPGSFQSNFKKICKDHLDLDDSDKGKLIDLFIGKAEEDNKFYKKFKKDKKSILEYYKQLLPYLEVTYFENKYIPNPPIKKERYSEYDIREIIKKYFYKIATKNNQFPDYDEIFKWTELAFVIAKQDNEQSIFEETDEYFDRLYKKTYLRRFFEDFDINIILRDEYDYQHATFEIGDILDQYGFFEKFGVDIDRFKSIFVDILEFSPSSKIDNTLVIWGIEGAYYIDDRLRLIEEDI